MAKLKIFRKFWGSWPGWFGEMDEGNFVYVRIRHGQVWIGEGITESSAIDNAEQVKISENYQGVTEAANALMELLDNGYYFVPSTKKG